MQTSFALREHVELGTHIAMQNSHATNDAELHPLREVPRTWAGERLGEELLDAPLEQVDEVVVALFADPVMVGSVLVLGRCCVSLG